MLLFPSPSDCVECNENYTWSCPHHDTNYAHISDSPMPTRARATVPSQCYLGNVAAETSIMGNFPCPKIYKFIQINNFYSANLASSCHWLLMHLSQSLEHIGKLQFKTYKKTTSSITGQLCTKLGSILKLQRTHKQSSVGNLWYF